MMPAFARDLLALPPEASTAAPGVDDLHGVVIAITFLGSSLVGLAALTFLVRYRRRGNQPSLTPRIVAPRLVEGGVAVLLLVMFVGWWIVGYRQFLAMQEAPEGAEVVYVTAKQWMWKFSYPDGQKTNDVLVVPEGRPVRLVMTSRDVIHSFYVPAFRQKRDVLPGRYVTTWFQATTPGTYPIRCAEYCGVSHSGMLGIVNVLTPSEYAAWLRIPAGRGGDASGGEASLAREGQLVAARRACLACHTVDGSSHPLAAATPNAGPTWSRLFGSEVLLETGTRVLADESYLTRSMMEPTAEVVAGYRPVMPSYRGILTQPETAALVEYMKSLRDGPAP